MITMLEPTEAQTIKLRQCIHLYWHGLPTEFNPLEIEFFQIIYKNLVHTLHDSTTKINQLILFRDIDAV
jgi:hypothetical protein